MLYKKQVAFNINQKAKISLSKVINKFKQIIKDFGGNNTFLELEHIVQCKADIDIITYYELFDE